ncbi:hypothetical protein BO71DRAFT_404614 [Aspergillus ellipticus CBS 707.79]|uniref:Secreted protein n=1 Tax=Aspergillus ellipticus CBS 707.79 TaxID=1448320 RepID=A0A319E8U8_9EURO|nr:hypothetical protein BO71DRAFT_404614 [Aspergillus ellipticus CBS 707.79]
MGRNRLPITRAFIILGLNLLGKSRPCRRLRTFIRPQQPWNTLKHLVNEGGRADSRHYTRTACRWKPSMEEHSSIRGTWMDGYQVS